MKIGILHQDLEWAEEELARQFQRLGDKPQLVDIRQATVKQLTEFDLVLNRVYASVANRNYKDNFRALDLLMELEKTKIPCINGLKTTRADYSKFSAGVMMNNHDVRNPKTHPVYKTSDIEIALEWAEKVGFPIIVKRDMGGRGKDIQKINAPKELEILLGKLLTPENHYQAGYIVQEFVESVRNYDCRIAIIDGKLAFSYSRTLIPTQAGGSSWLASVSNGSKMAKYKPSDEEVKVAIAATDSIDALFNEVDMCFTKQGPCIIENNPTPNYDREELDRVKMAAKLIKEKIKKY